MGYRLGSVPYVNAAPLVAMFQADPTLGVEVVTDVPSCLPALLESGEVDAILVSSHYLLTHPGLVAADSCAIGSDGPVQSVRLFSKVPLDRVASLALDASSMTSNALAQIVLRERYGVQPATRPMPPELDAMLAECDAAVLIGDAGMAAQPAGLLVLDLGEAWTEWTGHAFVWALWVGGDRLTPPLARLLRDAWLWSGLGSDVRDLRSERSAAIVAQSAAKTGLPLEVVDRYLRSSMRYGLDSRARQGLAEFARRLGIAGEPRWVASSAEPVGSRV